MITHIHNNDRFTVADPEFPRRGGANPRGAPGHDFIKISAQGDARPLRPAADLI